MGNLQIEGLHYIFKGFQAMSYNPQTFPSAEGLTNFQADTVPPDDLQTILAAFHPAP